MNSIPSGVVQFFEPISSKRRAIENRLVDFFKRYGYKEIVTPTFSYENAISKGLFEPLKTRLFKFIDRNSKETLTLRADITMQIMQAVFMGNFEMPARVCYAGNIYRDVKEHTGSKREIKQVGAELFGVRKKTADEEIIMLAVESLVQFGVDNITLRLSDTDIIDKLLYKYGLQNSSEIKALIGKKNISSIEKKFNNIPIGFVESLNELSSLSGYSAYNKNISDESYELIQDVVNIGKAVQSKINNIKMFFDLFYCEEPAYHHGMVFDIFSESNRIAVGGRYGKITEFLGRYIPATGFAIELDNLVYFLVDKGIV